MWRGLDIAGLKTKNNVFLAPLAGYTNYPFRRLCERLGAGLTFTEMVSCKGLKYGNENTKQLLYTEGECPKAAQIFGCDPDIMRAACEGEELSPFDLIDINMGCPMPKIVNNGEGSALLENFALAEKVISACVKSGKRISVKYRIGVTRGVTFAGEFARLCEGAGACMVTVHGRTRDMIYAGEADFSAIAEAKHAVKIPVVANGGVFSKEDAENLLNNTGADGVMVARGALYNPNLFREILGEQPLDVGGLFLEQLAQTEALYGERFAVVFMRKMAAFYLKGTRNAVEYKRRLFAAQTVEVRRLAVEAFGVENSPLTGEEST